MSASEAVGTAELHVYERSLYSVCLSHVKQNLTQQLRQSEEERFDRVQQSNALMYAAGNGSHAHAK